MPHDRKHNLNPAGPDRHPALPHDRRHDLNTDPADAHGHEGERKPSLSARSLAARGDALDGSEDGHRAEPDGEA